MYHLTLLTTLLLPLVSAHFQLAYPPTVGFSDEDEGTAPCGGVEITDASFSDATDFHVDGDAVALTSTHPESEWLFRATLDRTAAGDNFTNMFPIVSQTGLGAFCEPDLTVPAMWVGSMGLLQIQQVGSHGSLYQCAAVNFVPGKADAPPSECKNASGSTAEFSMASTTGSPSSSMMPMPTESATDSAAASLSTLSPAWMWSVAGLAALGSIGFAYV